MMHIWSTMRSIAMSLVEARKSRITVPSRLYLYFQTSWCTYRSRCNGAIRAVHEMIMRKLWVYRNVQHPFRPLPRILSSDQFRAIPSIRPQLCTTDRARRVAQRARIYIILLEYTLRVSFIQMSMVQILSTHIIMQIFINCIKLAFFLQNTSAHLLTSRS